MSASIRKYLAEMLGTFTLVALGGMSILYADGNLMVVSFGFGLALLAALYMFGGRSGGHFNPAVSLAMMMRKDITPLDFAGYCIGQVVGALAAAGLILSIGSQKAADMIAVAPGLSPTGVPIGSDEILILETVLTAVLVMVILRTTASHKKAAPLAISLALVVIHLAAVPITGASVNPARSLGPAIVAGDFTLIWAYLIAAGLGGVIAFYLDRFINGDRKAESPAENT